MSKAIISIIFVQRTGFYYITNQTNLEFPFTADIVSYLDIVNKEEFEKKILQFINSNKLQPSSITIVLGPDTLFEKEVSLSPKGDISSEEINAFTETVPFDEVQHIIIKSSKTGIIVATSSQLYNSIKEAFIKHSFEIISVTPYNSVTEDAKFFKPFSKETAQFILKKYDSLRQNNFLEQKVVISVTPVLNEEKTFSKQNKPKLINKRAVLLGVIFIILIGIMIFMFNNMQNDNAKTMKLKIHPTSLPPIKVLRPTPISSTIQPTQSTSSSAILLPKIPK